MGQVLCLSGAEPADKRFAGKWDGTEADGTYTFLEIFESGYIQYEEKKGSFSTQYENIGMSGWRPQSGVPGDGHAPPPPTSGPSEAFHKGPFKVTGSVLWMAVELELEWVSLHVIKVNGRTLKRTYRTNRK